MYIHMYKAIDQLNKGTILLEGEGDQFHEMFQRCNVSIPSVNKSNLKICFEIQIKYSNRLNLHRLLLYMYINIYLHSTTIITKNKVKLPGGMAVYIIARLRSYIVLYFSCPCIKGYKVCNIQDFSGNSLRDAGMRVAVLRRFTTERRNSEPNARCQLITKAAYRTLYHVFGTIKALTPLGHKASGIFSEGQSDLMQNRQLQNRLKVGTHGEICRLITLPQGFQLWNSSIFRKRLNRRRTWISNVMEKPKCLVTYLHTCII